jgi:hypothetical protein
LARVAARSTLLSGAFPDARIVVGADGRTVAIAIPRDLACTARPGEESRIVRRLKLAAPFLASVTVGVADSGKSLAGYVSARCAKSNLPYRPGPVVYQKTGMAGTTTASFKVRSPHWTVDFENDGAFFAAFVLRNDKPLPHPITASKRTVGSKSFTGPGTFRLRITGSGRWTVRVRESS